MYRCETKSTACNPHWHIGPGRAQQRGSIGLHLILHSIHNTATDRRWAVLHSNTSPVKKLAPMTMRSCSLIKVCICGRAPECKTVLQNRQRQNSERPRSNLPWKIRQDFENQDESRKLSWNQMSHQVYQGDQTPSA